MNKTTRIAISVFAVLAASLMLGCNSRHKVTTGTAPASSEFSGSWVGQGSTLGYMNIDSAPGSPTAAGVIAAGVNGPYTQFSGTMIPGKLTGTTSDGFAITVSTAVGGNLIADIPGRSFRGQYDRR